MPSVLKVEDESGKENYYLIVGTNGEKMNQAVQDFVALPVEVQAKAVQYDYSYINEHYGNMYASCATECSK